MADNYLYPDLSDPCSDCPFRTDGNGVMLSTARARQIAQDLEDDYTTFTCHKTVNARRKQHCAGAMIMLAHQGAANVFMRLFNPTINLFAPVVTSFVEFVAWHDANIMNRRDQEDSDGKASR